MAINSPGSRADESRRAHAIRIRGAQLVVALISAAVVLALPLIIGFQMGLTAPRDGAGLTNLDSGTPALGAPPAQHNLPTDRPEPVRAVPGAAQSGVVARTPPDPATAQVVTPEPTGTPSESPSPVATPSAISPASTPKAPAVEKVAPAPSAAASATPAQLPGDAMTIQVKASPVQSEAEAIAEQLIAKGYEAYVLPPATGAPVLFRVRVGKFTDRSEADAMAARLSREEKLETWLVRVPFRP